MNLKKALNGGRGALDAWLEVNNEAEVLQAINEMLSNAVSAEREACAKVCDSVADENAKSAIDEEYEVAVPRECAAAIRARGNGGAK